MAAPAFASIGTVLTYATSTSANIPVPSGVTSTTTDIVVAYLYMDTNQTVTAPLDFAEAGSSPMINTTSGEGHVLRVYWRRPSASDAGTYNFTHSSTGHSGFALRFTGCVASGNPFDVTTSAVSTVSVTTTPAVSGTTTVTDTLLLWMADNYNGNDSATLSGFTEHVDTQGMVAQSKSQSAAGSTGSLTSALSGGGGASNAWLGALKPTAVAASTNSGFFGMM